MSELIVGYDGTDCATAALRAACTLATETGDKVVLAYGYEPYHGAGDVGPHREALRELGEQVTREGLEQAGSYDVEVEVVLVAERPAEALVKLGAERDARMLVVGTYGESPLKGALLGSTPHKLLAISERPVLVVPA